MWTALLHALTAVAAILVGVHIGIVAAQSGEVILTLSAGAPLAVGVLLPLYVLARSVSIVEANEAATRAYKLNKLVLDELRAMRKELAHLELNEVERPDEDGEVELVNS